MKPIRYIRWRIAWWFWFVTPPTGGTAPIYHKSVEQLADYNRQHQQWADREPKRENYGL